MTSVQDYGAFVDIGGVEGLVHVSELAWDRVSRPQDLLTAGDAVQVQVLRIDEDPKKGERIGLSVKALAPRPEPVAPEPGSTPRPERVAPPPPPRVGDVLEATVDKIESFGVFVRFAGGRGLVPAERDRHAARRRSPQGLQAGRRAPGARVGDRRAGSVPPVEVRARSKRRSGPRRGRTWRRRHRADRARASAPSAICSGRSSRRSSPARPGRAPSTDCVDAPATSLALASSPERRSARVTPK